MGAINKMCNKSFPKLIWFKRQNRLVSDQSHLFLTYTCITFQFMHLKNEKQSCMFIFYFFLIEEIRYRDNQIPIDIPTHVIIRNK